VGARNLRPDTHIYIYIYILLDIVIHD